MLFLWCREVYRPTGSRRRNVKVPGDRSALKHGKTTPKKLAIGVDAEYSSQRIRILVRFTNRSYPGILDIFALLTHLPRRCLHSYAGKKGSSLLARARPTSASPLCRSTSWNVKYYHPGCYSESPPLLSENPTWRLTVKVFRNACPLWYVP